jgi:hypothetical protein
VGKCPTWIRENLAREDLAREDLVREDLAGITGGENGPATKRRKIGLKQKGLPIWQAFLF